MDIRIPRSFLSTAIVMVAIVGIVLFLGAHSVAAQPSNSNAVNSPILDYDGDGDGVISITELFDAIDDYFDGNLTITELFDVIDAYFSGGTPTPEPADLCSQGVAVPDRSNNPGLLSDCETLLEVKDELRGTAALNWSADVPMADWYYIEIDGNPARVQALRFPDAELNGRIPPELGNLSSLTYLNIYGNQLSGNIPPELGNLSRLTYLNVYDNQLSGNIPPELGSLSRLTHLYLGNNQLSGSIPSELGNLLNLEVLSLDENYLTGTIPPELGNLVNLTHLYLWNNQLTGSIPSTFSNLTNLEVLSLGDNQLTGDIPEWLENLTNLTNLYLGNNQLTGCVPQGLSEIADDDPDTYPDNDMDSLGLPFCGRSIDFPLPVGSDMLFDKGRISVTGIVEDVTQLVMQENQFNDPPAAGNHFYMVAVEFEHFRIGSEPTYISYFDFQLIGENRTLYDLGYTCGVFPDALGGEVYPGGTVQGNVCFEVADNDEGFILIYQQSFFGERIFLSLEE